MRTLVLFLCLVCVTQAEIKCELKSGNVNSAYNKVGEAALKGIKYHDGRNKNSMRLFQCTCKEDDELFDDSYIEDIEEDQGNTDWFQAEIFRIYDCKTLRLRLTDGRDSLADYFRQKLLIVEQIDNLELQEFDVGKLPTSSNYGTFSSIYFRDVKFTEDLDQLVFEDKYEVVFERVKLGENVDKMDILVENINGSINHVFRIEGSEFPGVSDVTSNEINNDIFKLDILQETPEMDGDNEECNYDYTGDVIIKKNSFGYLRREGFRVKGGNTFEFMHNSIEVINDLVFDIINFKNTRIIENNMGFSLKSPNALVFFTEGRNDCDDDELDLPENKIGHIQIKENKFVQNIADFIEIDKDPNYSDKFISDNVKIVGNEISQRCNCTSPDVPNDPNDRTDNEKVKKMFIDSSRCLSSQTPPLPGNRTDICRGTNPKTFERLQMEASEETKGKWTIYLVVAIFVTMLLTFCCTFAIMYFMCAANKDERSISP